jgi:4-hydroxy-3-methylbut-2-enyl diphosphate reductase
MRDRGLIFLDILRPASGSGSTIIEGRTGAVVAPGEVLVAETARCPSAPLLAGELTRRGIHPVFGRLDPPPAGSAGGPAAYALPGAGQHRYAMALAVHRSAGNRGTALDALRTWATARRPRTVVLAAPRSFCAGVDRAIEVVERALDRRGAPVYVRKQIVHNAHVVRDLAERGAVFVEELDEVPDGAVVVFSAHGVSPAVRAEADARGLDVIDATCPLVTKVHAEARRFAARGDTVVLIGHANHEEVEGTLGEAPGSAVLVETPGDVARLRVPDPSRVAYLTQTTLALDETDEAIAALRDRFPGLRGPGSDDICYASTNRQRAVAAVAAEADTVLVIGSDNSSNTLRLAELAERSGAPAYRIDDVTDIRPEWIRGADTVGVTAGASAPQSLIDDLIAALSGLGDVTVTERRVAVENVQFALPRQVRE